MESSDRTMQNSLDCSTTSSLDRGTIDSLDRETTGLLDRGTASSLDQIIDFLLEYCVMREDRDCCYLADDLRNMIQEKAGVSIFGIYTGSKQEGITNWNDTDVMFSQPDFIVVDSVDQIPIAVADDDDDSKIQNGVLITDTEQCYPGFTRLLVHREPSYRVDDDIYTEHENRKYLNAKNYLKYTSERWIRRNGLEMHGPAILLSDEKADLVVCLKVSVWPKCANGFRGKGLSAKVIEEIVDMGCHVVAVAHPQSENPDLEFRISFSVAEKLLIRKWTNEQLKCYFVFKELVKKHLGPDDDDEEAAIEKGLCSYFVKTLLLWASEDHTEEFWQQHSTLQIVTELLKIMKHFVVHRKCPNYFVPENLMVSSYGSRQLELISSKIEKIARNPFSYVLHSRAFEGFYSQHQLDTAVSVYETLRPLGVETVFNEIMDKIRDTLRVEVEEKITKTSWLMRSLNHHLSDFILFCSHQTWSHFCCNSPEAVLREVLDILIRMKDSPSSINRSPTSVKYFENCLQRCIAFHTLEKVFKIPETGNDDPQRRESLLDVETLLISSAQMPPDALMNDHNLSGYVHLGLFYYVLGFVEKSKQLLEASILLIKQHSMATNYNLVALPVILSSGYRGGADNNAPSFLRNKDEILTEIFEKLDLRVVEFDPLMMAVYLLYRISDSRDIDLLRKLSEMNSFVSHRASGSSTRKAYDYIRYRLGVKDVKHFT